MVLVTFIPALPKKTTKIKTKTDVYYVCTFFFPYHVYASLRGLMVCTG